MKKIILILTLFSSFVCTSQVIDSIIVSPQQPTTDDTVWVYVFSTFNHGGCDGTSSQDVIGNEINTSSIHCIGMLTFICNDVDTFKINPLPEGTYNFYHSLSSGSGSIPCSPGIVADDNDTLTFTVVSTLGIKTIKNQIISVYPNPVTDKCMITFGDENVDFQTLNVYDVSNRKVFSKKNQSINQIELDLTWLTNGVYFFEFIGKDGKVSELLRIIKE
jgi:hypothetical protein